MVASVPVTIGGVRYASKAQACREIKTTMKTIWRAEREGRLDDLKGRGRNCRPCPVLIDGVRHPSVRAYGRSIGVSWHTAKGYVEAMNAWAE